MAKLPQLSGEEVVRRLKRLGMIQDHGSGGHIVMRNPSTDKMSDVPQHGSRDIKKGTLNAILKQLSITKEEFAKG
jgi:predicted RNA binding protein YcfA (HicA-like mRNA interferase family)